MKFGAHYRRYLQLARISSYFLAQTREKIPSFHQSLGTRIHLLDPNAGRNPPISIRDDAFEISQPARRIKRPLGVERWPGEKDWRPRLCRGFGEKLDRWNVIKFSLEFG